MEWREIEGKRTYWFRPDIAVCPLWPSSHRAIHKAISSLHSLEEDWHTSLSSSVSTLHAAPIFFPTNAISSISIQRHTLPKGGVCVLLLDLWSHGFEEKHVGNGGCFRSIGIPLFLLLFPCCFLFWLWILFTIMQTSAEDIQWQPWPSHGENYPHRTFPRISIIDDEEESGLRRKHTFFSSLDSFSHSSTIYLPSDT